jgi:hypothetical protein
MAKYGFMMIMSELFRAGRMLLRSGYWVGLGLFASALAAFGQSNAVPRAHLVCDEPLYDFGTRPNTVEVEHQFNIRNSGELPLVISQVRSGCGCTHAQMSQSVIEPGSNAVLSVKLTLRGIVGLKRINIYLHSNDPDKPVFQCQLSGTAVADLSVSPSQLTFTYTPSSVPAPQRLIVTGQAASNTRITSIECQGAFFQAEIATNTVGYGVITVTPSTNTPVENVPGFVIIATDHPRFPRLIVPIQTTVIRDLNAYPPEITLSSSGSDPLGNVRYLILRAYEEQSFNVTNVVVIPPVFPARIHSTKPAWARLKVGPIPPGVLTTGTVVRVYTDKPGSAPLDIPVKPGAK